MRSMRFGEARLVRAGVENRVGGINSSGPIEKFGRSGWGRNRSCGSWLDGSGPAQARFFRLGWSGRAVLLWTRLASCQSSSMCPRARIRRWHLTPLDRLEWTRCVQPSDWLARQGATEIRTDLLHPDTLAIRRSNGVHFRFAGVSPPGIAKPDPHPMGTPRQVERFPTSLAGWALSIVRGKPSRHRWNRTHLD